MTPSPEDTYITQRLEPERLAFIHEALSHQGQPYIWAAKGPDRFDCSGLVTYCLQQATNGRLRWEPDHNADLLWRELEPVPAVAVLRTGDLVFYGTPARASHVMVYMGERRVYGACGGGRSCSTPDIAARLHACVQWRSTIWYRPDFLGCRRLPVDPPPAEPAKE